AAWFVERASNAILEVTHGGGSDVARTHIGPGTATFLVLAGCFARLAVRIRRYFEVTVITPVSINAKFDCPTPRLDNACAAHAGGTAGGLNSRGHSGLEPANGIGVFRQRIGEGPGTAASIPLAARR